MTDKPMTPGQVAFAAHERVMTQVIGSGSPRLWMQIRVNQRPVWDAVAQAVREQMLELFGVDEVFITEAAVVFEGLAEHYPHCKGPIEIVDAMIGERIRLRAFKARVEAGVEKP